MKKLFLTAFAMALLLCSSLLAKDYVLDKTHTDVGFKIKHLQISNVRGNFKDYDAVIDFDPQSKEFKRLEATVKVASVDTDNKTRDNHLQQDDFFKAKKFPDMTFVMKKYEKMGDDAGKMTGVLTIAGVSNELVLDVQIGGVTKLDNGKEKIGFSLEGSIKRSAFNFAPSTKTLTLSDEIKLDIEVEANEK